MNAPVRKPKPQNTPITLAELVLDLEARMEPDAGGEFLSAVELPGADWLRLVRAARDEQAIDAEAATAPNASEVYFKARVIEALGEPAGNPDSIDLVGRVKQFTEERDELMAFRASVAELVQLKGCPLHDDELIDRIKELKAAPVPVPEADDEEAPAEEKKPGKKRAALIPWDSAWDSNLLCARVQELGMTDLYKRMLGHTPHERRPAYKEAHELYLAGKLGAPPEPKKTKKAPPKAKAQKPTPGAAPTQIDLTEAITEKSGNAKPKPPTRATKKFPLNSGIHERCTKCGRMQGAHAGTTCPKHAHGDHSDDYDSNGKLLGEMVDGTRKEVSA